MTDIGVYRGLVLASDVDDAIVSTLQTWMPQYIAMVSRKIGQAWNWLPPPKSYVVTNDPNHWPEEQLPAVVVANAKTDSHPKRNGQAYRVTWPLKIVVFVSANDRPATERLAKYYGGAVRLILAQKPALGGIAAGTEWEGEEYNLRIADQDQRVLGSCANSFCVDVRNVMQAFGGPSDPNGDPSTPPTDDPIATHVPPPTLIPEAL